MERKHFRWLIKGGIALFVLNEIRGLIMAGPVIWAVWHAGGDWVAIWLAVCALGGIALSVIVPVIVAKRIKKRPCGGS